MPDIADVAWSERDDHNTEAVPNGWPTGAFPAYTDLVGQMMMGATKRFWNKINPIYQTTGTGDDYIVQTEVGIDQINLYEILCIRIDRSNTTSTPTLQFGATNSRTIVKAGTSGYIPLDPGDMYAGNSHTFWYNGAFYILTDPAVIVGTTVQPYSPNLTSWAAISRAAGFDDFAAAGILPIAMGGTDASTASGARSNLGLVIGTDVQAHDADLDSWAAITRASGYDTFAATPSSANLKALLTDETGSGAVVFADSPSLTGTPSAPTQASGDNSTNIATTAYVDAYPATSALQASVRDRLDAAPYVASRSAMLALDTTKDTTALFDGGLWSWSASDQSASITGSAITSSAVDSGTDTVTSTAHGLRTCDAVLAQTAVNGLSLNTLYYVIRVDADNFKLASSRTNALAAAAFDLTGTTNFSVKEHFDPDQFIWVTPTADLSGASGAWSQTNAVPTYSATDRMDRLNDRLLVGSGATGWNGLQKASGGAGSWLFEEGDGTTQMHYLLVNAIIAGVGDSDGAGAPYGVFGASRTPTGATSVGAIGVTGFAKGNGTSGSSLAWGGYFDAAKDAAANTSVQTVEIEISNLNTTPATYNTPYSTFSQGRTMAVQIGSGSGGAWASPQDADTALQVFNNGAKFRNGIVFRNTSLTADGTTGYMHALLMASKQRLEWYIDSSNIGFAIHGEVATAANRHFVIADDTGFNIKNVDGKAMAQVLWATSTVNYLRQEPTATGSNPGLTAQGDDSNLDLLIKGKGTGGGRLLSGDTLAKFRWSTTAIGFFGSLSAQKTGWSVDTGTAKRTANATYSGTAEAAYTQATIQTLMDKVRDLSQTIKALKDDLHSSAGYGLITT